MSNKKYFFYVYFTRGILAGIYGSIRFLYEEPATLTILNVIKVTMILFFPFFLLVTFATFCIRFFINVIKKSILDMILAIFLLTILLIRLKYQGAFDIGFIYQIILCLIIIFIESKILGLEYRG
ncbi:MAG: hypothetical protein PWP46_1909 [Fusobacteriaceae bacterium]|nr:hypothetical protein [Fusobacteriaceae bacterium]